MSLLGTGIKYICVTKFVTSFIVRKAQNCHMRHRPTT